MNIIVLNPIQHPKDEKLCKCGHGKSYHHNGRGLCEGHTGRGMCDCSRFRKPTGDVKIIDWGNKNV